MLLKFLILFQFLLFQIIFVNGHGYLYEPIGRASAWRKNFKTPEDFDDDGLFCGGFGEHWELNNGKCGICGDSFKGPRDHEVGGRFAPKPVTITATYEQGDIITVTVNLTTNHGGFFVFQVCPVDDVEKEATEECLNENNLEIVRDRQLNVNFIDNELNDKNIFKDNFFNNYHSDDDSAEVNNEIDFGYETQIVQSVKRENLFNPVDLNDHSLDKFKFFVAFESARSYNIKVKLINEIKCKRCVFRWIYVTGNGWDYCPNSNEGKKGCGKQEEFRNCADIAIY